MTEDRWIRVCRVATQEEVATILGEETAEDESELNNAAKSMVTALVRIQQSFEAAIAEEGTNPGGLRAMLEKWLKDLEEARGVNPGQEDLLYQSLVQSHIATILLGEETAEDESELNTAAKKAEAVFVEIHKSLKTVIAQEETKPGILRVRLQEWIIAFNEDDDDDEFDLGEEFDDPSLPDLSHLEDREFQNLIAEAFEDAGFDRDSEFDLDPDCLGDGQSPPPDLFDFDRDD